jgi:hypothetical protein
MTQAGYTNRLLQNAGTNSGMGSQDTLSSRQMGLLLMRAWY